MSDKSKFCPTNVVQNFLNFEGHVTAAVNPSPRTVVMHRYSGNGQFYLTDNNCHIRHSSLTFFFDFVSK